jgi:hypothetical protein
MYQSAYAAPPPYPGYPATTTIANGPSLGCNNTGTTNDTWVCGFDVLTTVTFKVDGRFAGTAEADSNGCVLIVLTFEKGKVSVDDNPFVPVRAGTNYVIALGFKTSKGHRERVGLRIPFVIPNGTSIRCATSPSGPPSTVTSTTFSTGPSGPPTTLFPRRPRGYKIYTTTTRYYPTTLARMLEVPLGESPNKVILESSLLAAVLAAVLSAGALGSIWGSGGTAPAGPSSSDGPASPPSGGDAGGAAAPSGEAPAAPPPPETVAAPTAPSTPAATPRPSAFQRPAPGTTGGGP